jgi:hypothetical protein
MDINTPWHITRFFPANRLSHISQTPSETLFQARQSGFEEGLKNVHVFLDKGCDCAKETCMVESGKVTEAALSDCCKRRIMQSLILCKLNFHIFHPGMDFLAMHPSNSGRAFKSWHFKVLNITRGRRCFYVRSCRTSAYKFCKVKMIRLK